MMRSASRWKAFSMLFAGFLAGVAFVIACGTRRGGGGGDDPDRDAGFTAGGDAAAQENGACSEWEVIDLGPTSLEDTGEEISGTRVQRVPAGWEPIGQDGSWSLRRCVR